MAQSPPEVTACQGFQAKFGRSFPKLDRFAASEVSRFVRGRHTPANLSCRSGSNFGREIPGELGRRAVRTYLVGGVKVCVPSPEMTTKWQPPGNEIFSRNRQTVAGHPLGPQAALFSDHVRHCLGSRLALAAGRPGRGFPQ